MIKRLKSKLNGDIHLKEILTGSAVTFVLKMSGMLLGYIVILIISRQYGAEAIGVYNLTLSVMTFVAMIAAMGINVSILRYVGQFNKSGEEYKLKLLYRYAAELIVPFSLFLSITLYFSAGFIAENVFHNDIYEPALKFAAFIVPFLALQNISVEFIRGLKKLKVSEFLRSVSRPIVNIVLLSILGLYIGDQLLPLYTLGVGIILSALFAVYFIVKKIQKIKYEKDHNFSKKELVSTSMPMMLTTIASFAMGNVTLIMIEIFMDTKEVGIFSVSLKIAMIISLILVVVNTISAPKFSELYWNKQYKELQNIINHSSKLILFIALGLSIVLMFMSEILLQLFGSEFIAGNFILQVLIVSQLINASTGSVGVFLNMTGHQKIMKNITIIALFVTVIFNYILIPLYGLNGAAFSLMFGTIILNIIPAIYVKIKLNYTTFYIPAFLGKNYEL